VQKKTVHSFYFQFTLLTFVHFSVLQMYKLHHTWSAWLLRLNIIKRQSLYIKETLHIPAL